MPSCATTVLMIQKVRYLCSSWTCVSTTGAVDLRSSPTRPGRSEMGDFLGPCTQVQGLGSCPQGHGPPLRCFSLREWTNTRVKSHVRTTTTATKAQPGCTALWRTFFESWRLAAMAAELLGAAARRPERRLLRSWLRHEGQTVAADGRKGSFFIWQSLVRSSPVEYKIMDCSGS